MAWCGVVTIFSVSLCLDVGGFGYSNETDSVVFMNLFFDVCLYWRLRL